MAQTYLVDQIAADKTATAVLGDNKAGTYDETWNVFPLSLDPKSGGAGQDKITL